MFFVLLSIAVFVLETHTWFRVADPGYNATVTSIATASYLGPNHCSCKIAVDTTDFNKNSEPHPAMTYLDYLSAAFFTLEFLVRIFFAPNKLDFFRQPLNVIDILCLVPHFTSIIIKTVSPSDNAGNILRSVLALRVIRVLRIFKLMKHYTAFKILVYTIKVSLLFLNRVLKRQTETELCAILMATSYLVDLPYPFLSILFCVDSEATLLALINADDTFR